MSVLSESDVQFSSPPQLAQLSDAQLNQTEQRHRLGVSDQLEVRQTARYLTLTFTSIYRMTVQLEVDRSHWKINRQVTTLVGTEN